MTKKPKVFFIGEKRMDLDKAPLSCQTRNHKQLWESVSMLGFIQISLHKTFQPQAGINIYNLSCSHLAKIKISRIPPWEWQTSCFLLTPDHPTSPFKFSFILHHANPTLYVRPSINYNTIMMMMMTMIRWPW